MACKCSPSVGAGTLPQSVDASRTRAVARWLLQVVADYSGRALCRPQVAQVTGKAWAAISWREHRLHHSLSSTPNVIGGAGRRQ